METKLGTYTYKHPTYTGGVRQYVEYQMRVQIVDERANKWKVKYLGQHASGAAIGTLHNVRKDKVRLDGIGAIVSYPPAPLDPAPDIKTHDDVVRALDRIYHREVRLPYKDD